MTQLEIIAQKDIKTFFKQDKLPVYQSEDDLKVQLAVYLSETKHYDRVFTEYIVPTTAIPNYLWENKYRIYVDIVLQQGDKYYLVELKYKTKQIKGITYKCFGKDLLTDMLANQSAYNYNCYEFWKDVWRIECLSKSFDNIIAGIVIFLTNDKTYWSENYRKNTDYYLFSINPNMKDRTKEKRWMKEKDNKPSFELHENYEPEWVNDINIQEDEFRYCFVELRRRNKLKSAE